MAQRGQAPQSKPASVLDDQPQSAPASINQSPTDVAPALTTFRLSYTNGDKYGGYVVVDVCANEIGRAGALFAAIRKANELKLSPGPDFSVNGRKLEPGMFPEHLKHRLLSHVQVDVPSREPTP